MKIKSVNIKNYRLLKDVSLSFDNKITLIVGRNNTGKTSLAEIFHSFLSSSQPKIRYEDFNQSCLMDFEDALNSFKEGNQEENIRQLIPSIELKLKVDYRDDDDFGILADFIVDLDDSLFETCILISYQLKGGKIKEFFQNLNTDDRKKYFSDLRDQIDRNFECVMYAIDPNNIDNKVKVEFTTFKKLILSGLINAQRGLDDETHHERDVLGKSLGNLFKSANCSSAVNELRDTSEKINEEVKKLQKQIDDRFQKEVESLLPALSLFGYPGLQDRKLSATTELNAKSLLESNTRIFYKEEDHFVLPETYNGLGSRNLIFILFRIYEYFREFQSQSILPKGHLIFIEEPEAHLHPQMQEVFIRQLEQIVIQFQDKLNNGKIWPVQFVVSTHSSHIANETDFSKVRYFLTKSAKETKVKDLSFVFDDKNDMADKDFLHKYLTLTKCDLYFADRAIFIEGPSERILLPKMIEKVDESKQCNLRQKYISIVEIGGAYAHRFYKFIDFLELKTLVITDLDSGKKSENGTCLACCVSEGSHSTNAGLSAWFGIQGRAELAVLQPKNESSKISNSRRLAFQIPENSNNVCGRSFEDAFILANMDLFELQNLEGEKLEQIVTEKVKKIGENKKTDFAIQYSIEQTIWVVPKYISEGLEWLDK